jgi:hypothetical protein
LNQDTNRAAKVCMPIPSNCDLKKLTQFLPFRYFILQFHKAIRPEQPRDQMQMFQKKKKNTQLLNIAAES